jgi:hypothetical protein
MQDNRFGKHMNWDHKKCHCENWHDKWKQEHEKLECKCECKRKHDKCQCEREHEMKHEKCHCHEEKREHHDCKGCACDFLRHLDPGTHVDIFLTGGGRFLGLIFLFFNPKTCCAYFLEDLGKGHTTITIDCQKVDAIRKAAAY